MSLCYTTPTAALILTAVLNWKHYTNYFHSARWNHHYLLKWQLLTESAIRCRVASTGNIQYIGWKGNIWNGCHQHVSIFKSHKDKHLWSNATDSHSLQSVLLNTCCWITGSNLGWHSRQHIHNPLRACSDPHTVVHLHQRINTSECFSTEFLHCCLSMLMCYPSQASIRQTDMFLSQAWPSISRGLL